MPRVAAVVVGALVSAAPGMAASLTRGSYLQLLTTHSVTVVWKTDAPAACGLTLRPVGGSPVTVAGVTGTVCTVPLTGLTAGGQYGYTPLADGVPLRAESLFQVDDPGLAFSFLVVGDSGCACGPQYAVREAMQKTPADFLLHTGDMIYDTGAAVDFDPEFFVPYQDLIRRVVFWPCLGNHDFATASGAPWRDAFSTPANNPAHSENYYSFDVGNAHVVVLDSNESTSPGSAQHTFLDQDLGASAAVWKFVAFHHTIYSSGAHGSDLALQANLVPLFDKHAVDVVFMGHDHDYERTRPLRANQVVAPGAGTVYITTGGGGKELRPVGTSSFTAYAEATSHFTRVAISGGSLLAHMVRVDGTIGDTMTLVKGAPGPPPSCGDNLVDQPTEECDGPDHPRCLGPCAADCTCVPVCGDGRRNQASETCDGSDDATCPGLCLADCRCGDPAQFLTLAPVADTYIESGAQAAWDHGASDHLDVDQSPVDIAYLKFDLSAVPVAVRGATLTLSCTNTSADGGAVYGVGSTAWVEGTRTGLDSTSATGPGLKWNDVDSNRDGAVDGRDTSPYVPDFSRALGRLPAVVSGRTYGVALAGAFQAGPGLYALAITNNNTDGTTYSSREHANQLQRPRLRLELASPLPTTTTTRPPTTSTSTTRPATTTTSSTRPATTSTTTTSRSTTTLPAPSTTTVSTSTSRTTTTAPFMVPGAVEADVMVREAAATTSFGSNALLEATESPGSSRKRSRTFLRVGVTGLANRAVVTARVRLQVASVAGGGSVSGGRIHAVTACAWSSSTMTWDTQPSFSAPVLSNVGAVQPGEVVEFDVTGAITRGDGTYCFAIDSLSTDAVNYNSLEAPTGQGPQFVVGVAP